MINNGRMFSFVPMHPLNARALASVSGREIYMNTPFCVLEITQSCPNFLALPNLKCQL